MLHVVSPISGIDIPVYGFGCSPAGCDGCIWKEDGYIFRACQYWHAGCKPSPWQRPERPKDKL